MPDPFETVAQTLAASPDFAKSLAEGRVKLDMGYENLDQDDWAADASNTRPYLRVAPVPPAVPATVAHIRSRMWSLVWFVAFVVTLTAYWPLIHP